MGKSFFRIGFWGGVFFLALFFLPWEKVNWGKIQLAPSETITVVGEAKTTEKNQRARFTAGVVAVNDDKDKALEEANQKIRALIEAVKKFGVEEKDIKTESFHVYQEQEQYYEEGRKKTRPGQWRVSNSIEIILREVDRASDLASVLTRSGATNVYGPNFFLEEEEKKEEELISQAVKNAREKAEKIAQASGRKLGKVISVTEGENPFSFYRAMEDVGRAVGGGGTPLEPGSSTRVKRVTVVFQLK
ncbi:SIMPL domain-containing protein [bacterium]|nr:SIMPL domain-containing protein [bacterium]